MPKIGIKCCFCAVSLFLASSSWATQDASPPVDGIIPAGSDCMKGATQGETVAMLSVEQGPVVGLTGQTPKKNIAPEPTVYSHRITIADMDTATATLIDIRDMATQAQLSIPNTLSMNRDLIASRHFLRTHNLVLIGSGQDANQLEKTAAALETQGFSDVTWLQGGIRAWIAAGRRTVGTGGATRDQLSASDFHRWAAGSTLHQIWLGDPSQQPASLSADAVVNPQLPKWNAQLRTEIEQLQRADPLGSIVIITQDADWHSLYQIAHQAQNIQAPNLWWLQYGWAAYQQYTQQHLSMLTQKDVSLHRPCTAIE